MWQDFLRQQAKNHSLSPEETETLLKRFPEKERYIKTEAQFTEILNEGISDVKHKIGVDTVTKRMQEIYKKFQADCPQLQQSSRGKLGILRQWLIEQFIIIDRPKTLNRCILGLKGNYQKAQQKLTEITTTLQNRLKDKTLSITKVEEGSIILIVESSQTGYEQLKRLIGEEVAGFPVEYAIDEWQDICRRMLLKQKYLTINEIIGQVDGNRDRNLIDEDLFVDLALVKPKQSEKPKHPQDIDPEKGSDFFTRQEVEETEKFAYKKFRDKIICERTEKNIAIIGEAGAGKTTLLQKLAFWLLQETDDLVVWVSLAELGSQPLGEYLEQKWLKDALGLSKDKIKADWEQKFKGGTVWLLLDGLDEMSQTNLQGLNFRGWVMNAPIIVTCRLNLWQANPSQLQGFQTYLTQPFQDEQMQEFIRRWFPGLVGAAEADWLAESLWSQLQAAGKERIKDLCRNPLRLTLLCATWKVDNALPDITAALYAEFVEWIYKHKQKAFPVMEEEKERLNGALGELAKASLEAETGRFRLTHRLVCEYLGKPKAAGSLFPLALKLSWLNEVGVAAENRREKVYGFYHATFQEYFAALAVEDWDYFLPKDHCDRPVEGKRYRIFEKQWKQVILLWLGREDKVEEKEEFIRALVEFKDGCGDWNYPKVDRGFYGYQAYFLAAAGIAELKQSTWSDNIVEQLVKFLFGYLNQDQKRVRFIVPISDAARDVLPNTAKPKAIAKLTNLLNQTNIDEGLQVAVSENLGRIDRGNQLATHKLVEVLASNENESNRQNLANILREIAVGNEGAIQELIKVSQSAYKSYTRKRWVAYALGEIGAGNQTAITELINVTQKSNCDLYTRALISYTLGQIDSDGYKLLIQSLIRLLANSENQDIRTEVTETLSRVNPGYQLALKDLMDELSNLEKQVSKWHLKNIIKQIAVDNEFVIRELIRLLVMPDGKDVRWEIAHILEVIAVGHELAIRELTRLSQNPEYKEIHSYANSILKKIAVGRGQMSVSNELAILELMRVLENSDEANLRQIHGEATPWYFEQLLEGLDKWHRHDIHHLIHRLEHDRDPSIPWFIARCLEEIIVGNELAIGRLVRFLEGNNNNSEWKRVAGYLQNQPSDYPLEILDRLLNRRRDQLQQFEKRLRILEGTNSNYERGWMTRDLSHMLHHYNYKSVARELIRLLSKKDNEIPRKQIADCLREMFVGDDFAIQKLTEFERHHYRRLNDITPSNNLRKIWQLIGLLETNTNQSVRKQAGDILQQYYVDYQFDLDIEELIHLLTRTDNEYPRYHGAFPPPSRQDMNRLTQEIFQEDTFYELTRNTQELTDWLERNYSNVMQRIDPGNELAIGIQELMRLLGSSDNQSNQNQVLNSLKAIVDSESAIRKNQPESESADNEIENQANLPELISLLESAKDRTSCRQVANRINEMLTTQEQYIDVVASLGHNLTNEVYKSNYNLFYYCYKLIWNCAENLPYPEFYQAWHNPPTTPHPEVTEQTPHSGEQTFA
ncbi:NACHT domain-containing NTPase, partial [Limnospira fusiformis]|uniref:NACHT domain-containing NTPase n=1 Tax=Limnospira fusiformis TaxID=54297 RepID=UPI002AA1D02C|nr:NACHT domain-containing protein [Limnospira fusiformis LS22]